MKVSAIMPHFNQHDYIDDAVKSVINQVDELIVVDDGSDPAITPYPNTIHMRNPENQGIAFSVNKGFRATIGDLVTWVSSDNVHTNDWRKTLEKPFHEGDVGVAYSSFYYGFGGQLLKTPYDRERLITQEACYFGPSFLIRRDVWLEAGEHRGKLSHDYDHWLRVEEACWDMGLDIVSIPNPLCTYRVHNQRVTVTRKHEYDAKQWQEEARTRRKGRG